MYKKAGIVLGVVAAIAASVIALQRSDAITGPDDPATSGGLPKPSALSPPDPIQPTRAPILDEAAPLGRGAAVGPGIALPQVTTKLTDVKRAVVDELALSIPDVAENLDGKRFLVLGAEIVFGSKIAACGDPVARNCARVSIFNYTDSRCIRVLLDLEGRKSLDVELDGGCSVSAAETQQARQIAEGDTRVQQVIQEGKGKYIGGRIVFPRPGTGIAGDRYVSAKYTLVNGTASAEFAVDLTAQTLCYEC